MASGNRSHHCHLVKRVKEVEEAKAQGESNARESKSTTDVNNEDAVAATDRNEDDSTRSDNNKKSSSSYLACRIGSNVEHKGKVLTMFAKNIPDDHSSAPILPPDVIPLFDEEHDMSCLSEGKLWYNCLRHNNTKRKYVKGSYHDSMFDHKYSDIIDWNHTGDLDIVVLLPDSLETTSIKIRRAPDSLCNDIVQLNKLLKTKVPNCRGKKFGDSGKMYSMGKRSESKEYSISNQNEEVRKMMTSIGLERKKWFKEQFPIEYKEYFSSENKLDYMKTCLSDFMVHSVNLRNASHYDVNDATITTATWVEDKIGETENWYFVFPNLTRDLKRAMVVKLFQGCTINWDGKLVRHASSLTRLRGGAGRSSSAGNCELRRRNRR